MAVVAPYPSAWIETGPAPSATPWPAGRAPPGRVDRNMTCSASDWCRCRVAPYPGAWIETFWHGHPGRERRVAPYPGVWIEAPRSTTPVRSPSSRPTRALGQRRRRRRQAGHALDRRVVLAVGVSPGPCRRSAVSSGRSRRGSRVSDLHPGGTPPQAVRPGMTWWNRTLDLWSAVA